MEGGREGNGRTNVLGCSSCKCALQARHTALPASGVYTKNLTRSRRCHMLTALDSLSLLDTSCNTLLSLLLVVGNLDAGGGVLCFGGCIPLRNTAMQFMVGGGVYVDPSSEATLTEGGSCIDQSSVFTDCDTISFVLQASSSTHPGWSLMIATEDNVPWLLVSSPSFPMRQ